MIRIKISATKVRNMCIEYGLYGAGDSAEYDAMLEYCNRVKNEVDECDLKVIALDIIRHTNAEVLRDRFDGDILVEDMVNLILYEACSLSYRMYY